MKDMDKNIGYCSLKKAINEYKEIAKNYDLGPKEVKCGFLVVDPQNDFCEADLPNGSKPGLPVGGSTKIVGPINRFKEHFPDSSVSLTKDSHVSGDITFASTHEVDPFTVIPVTYTLENGDTVTKLEMSWPNHCIEGTVGCELHPDLVLTGNERIYRKGHGTREAYSAIFNTLGEQSTALLDDLNRDDIRIVFVSGLARDYCVGNTALDLAREGFLVVLLEDCTAFVAEGSNDAINTKFENPETRVYSMKSTDILNESYIEPTDRLYPKIGGGRAGSDN
jgi:nicotinamidase/pyrazinamidase